MNDELLKKTILGDELYYKGLSECINDIELENREKETGINKEELIKYSGLKERTTIVDKGLRINNITITTLNGPSSLRILKPVNDNLPLMIMLGDIHFTINGQCDICECINDSTCCLHTFNPYFLELLDWLGSKNNPIDLYTEEFNLKYKEIDKTSLKKYLENKFYSKFKVNEQLLMFKTYYYNCYNKNHKQLYDEYIHKGDIKMMEEYEDACPTLDTRWNFSDIRVLEKSTEGSLFNYIKDNCVSLISDKNIRLIELLNELNINKFVELLLDSKSYINKQIIKAKLNKNKEIQLIKKYVTYISEQPCAQIIKENNVDKIVYIKLTPNYIKSMVKQKHLENLFSIYTHLTSFMVEIYCYYRMLKHRLYTEKSKICLTIFGDSHCKFFSYFLTNIAKMHTQTIEVLSEINKQCLVLSNIYFDLNGYKSDVQLNKIYNYNSRFKVLELFRKYFLGDLYVKLDVQYDINVTEKDLLDKVNLINKNHNKLDMTLYKLKNITKFDHLIKETILNKKIHNNRIDIISNNEIIYATSRTLKLAIQSNNFEFIFKLLDKVDIYQLLIVDDKCIYALLINYNDLETNHLKIFERLLEKYHYKINKSAIINVIKNDSPNLKKYIIDKKIFSNY